MAGASTKTAVRTRVPVPARSPRKEDRLNIRVSREEKALIAQAALARHQDTGEFVRQTALLAAQAALAETSILRLSPEQWAVFQTRLDEKPRDLPRLRALFSGPSVFEE